MANLILTFICGVGLFLFAIYIIDSVFSESPHLSPKIEKKFEKPWFCFVFGVFSAAFTQSSSAINSILTTLRDRDKIKEKSTFFAIAGSNIGTTATAFLAVMQSVSASAVFSALIFVSTLILMFSKRDNIRKFALPSCGLSMIFISFSLIKGNVPELINHLNLDFLTARQPLIPFAICLLLTALCQSSSLVSVLIVSFAKINAVSLVNAIFMIMAANIGTCSTIFLVSVGKSKRSLRVAVFNLLFNVLPAVFFIVAYYSKMLDGFLALNVAMDTKTACFHTLFNVAACIIVCPFIGWFTDDSVKKQEVKNSRKRRFTIKKPVCKKRA